MIRFAIFLFLTIVLYNLLKHLLKSSRKSQQPNEQLDKYTAELVRDPQCGTYILPAQGNLVRLGDKRYHFCSERCRDQFLAGRSEEEQSEEE
jgi:YHS domain-containing protein